MQKQSEATPQKEFDLERLTTLFLNLVNAFGKRYGKIYPIYFIDLNAGAGYNFDTDCIGSPLVFLKASKHFPSPCTFYFIEKDKETFSKLEQLTAPLDNCFPILGENKEVLPYILDRIPKNSYGIIYSDPNSNYKNDYQMLYNADQHPNTQRLDIVVRFNSGGVKRTIHLGAPRLEDYLKLKTREAAIIQVPTFKLRWTFLILTNWSDYPAWKKHRFVKLNSPQGRKIFNRINYLNGELLDHTIQTSMLDLIKEK